MLESAVYAKFAAKNTVEFLVTEEMDRALKDKNPLIRTYRATDPYGDPVEYLVEFPGVTIEQLRRVSNSKAVQFISSAKRIPYSAVVDPHTGKQMEGFVGVRTPKEFIAIVRRHAKALKAKYGDGVERKVWNDLDKGGISVDLLLGSGRIADALGVYEVLARSAARHPKVIRNRVSAIHDTILADAEKRLGKIDSQVWDKRKRSALKKEVKQLARALQDTPLEKRALELLKKLK